MARILMLGDDPDLAEAGRTILMGEGYTVAMAHDIPDALALRDHLQPSLVFIDVTGHDLNEAADLSARLRDGGVSAPILIIGSKGRVVEFFTYDESGTIVSAPDFPEKPMQPAALIKNVRHALEQASAGA
jgi:DNA-binding NtrC family response regulator